VVHSVVHLLRGRELGFQTALTGSVWCTKHKTWQIIISIVVIYILMIAYIHTLLHAIEWFAVPAIKPAANFGHVQMSKILIYMLHMFNVVEELW